MQPFIIGSKTTSIFPSTKPEAPIIYLNIFSDEGRKVYETAQATVWPLFTLVSISDLDWNHDMSPWNSPPAFKNVEPCTGGAVDYLRYLSEKIIPMAEKDIGRVPRWRGVAGYSLAGLFALYSIFYGLFKRTPRRYWLITTARRSIRCFNRTKETTFSRAWSAPLPALPGC